MRFNQPLLRSVLLSLALAAVSFGQSTELKWPDADYNFPTSMQIGVSYTLQFTGITSTTGNQTTSPKYFLTVVSGSLPPGLSNSNNTNASAATVPQIRGVVASPPRTYTVTVIANDQRLPTPRKSPPKQFTINVPVPTVTFSGVKSPAITVGTVLSGSSSLLATVVGGNNPVGGAFGYTAAIVSGSLPSTASVQLDQASYSLLLAGVFLTPGTYRFGVVVSDASTPPIRSNELDFVLSVTATTFQVLPADGHLPGLTTQIATGTSLPAGNNPLAASPYATGGVPPYRWSIQGIPPPGLTLVPQTPTNPFLANAYSLTGTPTAAGTYSYLAQATDSSTNSVTVTQPYTSIVISPAFFRDPASLTAPATTSAPTTITTGLDGTLWFTQESRLQSDVAVFGVESVATSGTFQHETKLYFPDLPIKYPTPGAIAGGPDGSLWVTGANQAYIYQVRNSGTLGAHINLQVSDSGTFRDVIPTNIISGGAEGGVWFTGSYTSSTNVNAGVIGRIDPADPTNPRFFPVPALPDPRNAGQKIIGIVQDPSDATIFWFLDSVSLQIAAPPLQPISVTYVGRFTSVNRAAGNFSLPTGCPATVANQRECPIIGPSGNIRAAASSTRSLMLAAGGVIWFQTQPGVGTIAPSDGSVVLYPAVVGLGALGSDGAIWGISTAGNIARTTTSGAITTFTLARPAGTGAQTPGVGSFAAGPDGAIWAPDRANNRIVQIFPSLSLDCGGTSSSLTIDAPTTVSCKAVGGKSQIAGQKYTYAPLGALPAGLTSVTNADGSFTISGTPLAPGIFTVSASDASSPPQQASQVFSSLPSPLQFTCAAIPTTGYKASLQAKTFCPITGGALPYKYSVTGSLPPGLNGVGATNIGSETLPPSSKPCGSSNNYCFSIAGIIDPNASGSYSFTVVATDSLGTSVSQDVSLVVAPADLSFTCAANVQVVVGEAFQVSCFGIRGNPPYTYAATGLPSGISIDPTSGVISGIATTSGQAAVTVKITDSSSPPATVANQTLTLYIASVSQTLGLVCDFSARAQVGQPYSARCTQYGGTAPFKLAAAGTVPPGLTLQGSAVSGAPTSPGQYLFTLTVTDAAGLIAQQTVRLFVHPTTLTILSTTLPVPSSNLPYAAVPLIEGGTPPYLFSVTAGALPGGLTLNSSSGVISGAAIPGNYQAALQVMDATGATATQTFSFTVSAASQQPSINSYAIAVTTIGIPNIDSGVNGVVSGPDGSMWFTGLDQGGGNVVGSISIDGKTSKAIVTPSALTAFANASGGDITVGSDGSLWVAERDGNMIAQQPADQSKPSRSFFPLTARSNPSKIVAAPNGAVWFTEATANQIGHVDAGGQVVEFSIPTPGSQPSGIAVAPDNSVWFTEQAANKIGFVSVDGLTKNDFAIPTPGSQPTNIVLGPDNAFWFTESAKARIGRVDLAGKFSEYPITTANSAPEAITVGSDGALYFTDRGANQIGRLTIAGVFSSPYPVADSNSGLSGITTAPDGTIWYAESRVTKIGRLNLVTAVAVNCTVPTSPIQAQSAFSGACVASGGTLPYTFAFDPAITPPPGIVLDAKTGALSGTVTLPGTFSFDIQLQDSSSPVLSAKSASYTIVVSPLPLSASCTLPIARWVHVLFGWLYRYKWNATVPILNQRRHASRRADL